MLQRIVVASANPNKVQEIEQILRDVLPGVALLPRPADLADVVEDAPTLEANARLKALAIFEATGLASLADDTGLFVEALEDRPGVRTARYAGPEANDAANRAKLLRELTAVGARDAHGRRAVFRTVVVLLLAQAHEIVCEGTVSGTIAPAEKGSRGFGYDPLFVPDEGDGRTFAEMSDDEKHQLSHRGRALRALCDALGER
jgi:XTP/dITP diphosphohydrolase